MPFIPKIVRSGEKRMSTYLKETYGPIAGAYIGTRPMVFLTDYNLVKELYKARIFTGGTAGPRMAIQTPCPAACVFVAHFWLLNFLPHVYCCIVIRYNSV